MDIISGESSHVLQDAAGIALVSGGLALSRDMARLRLCMAENVLGLGMRKSHVKLPDIQLVKCLQLHKIAGVCVAQIAEADTKRVPECCA